ncbi:MAG: hypothetical protein KME21_20270 [Desmonostoc vinosum HA7617-LM4]|nr:hypothetical protein [Desmonostoc vinosum HA7617-LM4]
MGIGDWGLGTGNWGLVTGDWELGIGYSPRLHVPASSSLPHLRGLSEVVRGASPTGEAHSPFHTHECA